MKIIKNMVILAILGILVPINAYSLTITLDQLYSGTSPIGSSPTIVITQDGANAVQVVINANMTPTEFIDRVLLNYGGANPLSSESYSSGVTADTVSFASNSYKADGAGYFDLKLDYPQSAGSRLGPDTGIGGTAAGSTSTYIFSVASGGISPNDFHLYSTASPKGAYEGAMHIQSIGTNAASGWIGGNCTADCGNIPPPNPEPTPAPEPTTVWMLGLGLLGLFGYKYRQSRLAA